MRTILAGYKAYHFKDHDPVLDAIDTLISDAGNPKMTSVEAKSGVRAATLYNWRRRKTKRPQFATVKAVVKSLGGDLSVTYKGKVVK